MHKVASSSVLFRCGQALNQYRNKEVSYTEIGLFGVIRVLEDLETRTILWEQMDVDSLDESIELLESLYHGYYMEYDVLEEIERQIKKASTILGGNL